ncbi:MAG TPA: fatty acid desaturase [Puia sp.]
MHTKHYKIPGRINGIITVICSVLYFFLLWEASHVHHYGWVLLCGFFFAVNMVPVYSLIHEAEHGIIHPNETVNNIMGRWLSTLFIAPYTFFKHCHLKHHKKNRTDEEMWDLYYEHQEKSKKYGTLYGMMIGLGYFSMWLAVLLYALAPRLIYTNFFYSQTEIGGFLKGSDRKDKVYHSRWESIFVILFQVLIFYALDLQWTAWLTLFVMHGFLWSSQNYVNHAFSPRDIINGAHNLKMPAGLKWLYLNFNLHLAHHQNPKIPWIQLPDYVSEGSGRITFLRNYLRLWKGPRLTHEPSPLVSNATSTFENDVFNESAAS